MPKRKLVITTLLFFLLLTFGFYLFNKGKTQKNATGRIYTNEKVTESSGSLVEDFPNVPVYPGIRLDKSYKKVQEGKTDFSAVWYYEGSDDQSPIFMKWYVEEFKKEGWIVEGPFVDESENELSIRAQNSKYVLRLFNSERDEGDEGGAGKIIVVDMIEK